MAGLNLLPLNGWKWELLQGLSYGPLWECIHECHEIDHPLRRLGPCIVLLEPCKGLLD